MEDNTEEKQRFLRDNILENGYDGEEFVKFFFYLNGEDMVDLDNWSRNDLMELVEKFIKNCSKKDENNQNEKYILKPKYNSIINTNKMNNNMNNEINETDETDAKEQIGIEFIQCKIIEKTKISHNNNAEIIISYPELVDKGLFSKRYLLYLIETKPLNIKVKRKQNDFIWLHDILKKLYINCIIPPFSYKKIPINISDKLKINKRMNLIKKFMNSLFMHPQLRNSQILYDFISIKEDSNFGKNKIFYEKLLTPSKIEEIKTLKGQINVAAIPENEKICEKIKNIAEININLIKKMNTEYKKLNTQIEGVISKISDIKIIWEELYRRNKSIFIDGQDESIPNIYNSMSYFMENWKKNMENNIKLINLNIREFFRYIKNEYISIKEYYNLYDQYKSKYYNSYTQLMDKKEKLFRTGEITKWGLDTNIKENYDRLLHDKKYALPKMLAKETKIVNDEKKIFGVYLNSLIDEYKRINENIGIKENISNFIKEIKFNSSFFQNSLNDINDLSNINKESSENNSINQEKNNIVDNKYKNENLDIINQELKQNIDDLNNKLKNEKNENQKFNQKIKELEAKIKALSDEKNKLQESNNKIKMLKNTENDNPSSKLLEDLVKELTEKKNEIKELKSGIMYRLNPGEKLMSVIFISVDQKIHHSIICKNSDKFAQIEQKLYDEYPEYLNTENYFMTNGLKINRFKTLDENNIKNSSIITLNQIE